MGFEASELPPPVDLVLDGDTVVRNAVAFHVLGIDAPELGPWADCWAEAALAGHAKRALESLLQLSEWKVVEFREPDHSVSSVEFVRDDGGTVSDSMVVGGYAGASLVLTCTMYSAASPHRMDLACGGPQDPSLISGPVTRLRLLPLCSQAKLRAMAPQATFIPLWMDTPNDPGRHLLGVHPSKSGAINAI
jgi:hypothetical protein